MEGHTGLQAETAGARYGFHRAGTDGRRLELLRLGTTEEARQRSTRICPHSLNSLNSFLKEPAMPYLLIQTNKAVGDEEQSRLLTEASKIVAATLNKPEKYVMTAWTPAPKMTFDGDANGAAFLELRSVGIPEAARQKLPGALAKCMAQHLGINADRVYLVMVDVPGKYWAQGEQTFG